MSEVMTDAINATVSETLDERKERAAAQPKVDLPDDQAVINEVLDGNADLAFEVEYEVLPAVLSMEDAMRFALTAGVTSSVQADET